MNPISLCENISVAILLIHVRFEVFTAITKKKVVLWYIKPPFHTVQETHYISATESSRIILCKI
jgi:hypothetical protein